jgi:hypothetical protein
MYLHTHTYLPNARTQGTERRRKRRRRIFVTT